MQQWASAGLQKRVTCLACDCMQLTTSAKRADTSLPTVIFAMTCTKCIWDALRKTVVRGLLDCVFLLLFVVRMEFFFELLPVEAEGSTRACQDHPVKKSSNVSTHVPEFHRAWWSERTCHHSASLHPATRSLNDFSYGAAHKTSKLRAVSSPPFQGLACRDAEEVQSGNV